MLVNRSGVEDTRLEAKAKDTKKNEAKDQGHRRKFLPKKKRYTKNFSNDLQKKRSSKNSFRRTPKEENKKDPRKFFLKFSGVFQQNFNGSKNSAVLEPRTGQFLRT